MSNERPKILLKTDTETITLGARARGEILSNTKGMRRTQVTKPGEKIEISVVHGRWLIVKMPARR